jgi:hypothetical protein
MKAYDSVRQDFLLAILRTIGFFFFLWLIGLVNVSLLLDFRSLSMNNFTTSLLVVEG